MLNHKTRTHRTSSTVLTNLNKENNFELANRLCIQNQKKPNKLHKLESKQIIRQEIFPKRLQELTKKVVVTKQALSPIHTIDIKIDIKKIQNHILKTNYSKDVLEFLKIKEKQLRMKDILLNHKISKELRSKMVDWMIQVLSSYKFTEYSFFAAVRYMDSYFMKTKTSHEANQLHLIGTSCIFMACKYEEIYPLKAKVIHEKIAHKKLSEEQIVRKQSQILSILDFDLTGVSHFQILLQVIEMSQLQNQIQEKYFEYLKKVCLYICKMILYDIELVENYSYTNLAISTIYVGFKIIQQVQPLFSPDQKIKAMIEILKIKQEEMIEAAAKILNLAKSFHKIYPNLNNLKKFNSFSFAAEEPYSARSRNQNQ